MLKERNSDGERVYVCVLYRKRGNGWLYRDKVCGVPRPIYM